MSIRGHDWAEFSIKVLNHVEEYTVKQYGDKGDDLASEYTKEQCLQQVKKYLARQGKNQREGQDKLDMLKMAHYLQMAWTIENEKIPLELTVLGGFGGYKSQVPMDIEDDE